VCDKGFLSTSWTAIWAWDSNNVYAVDPGISGYVIGGDGFYHYDPNGASYDCANGSAIIPCPAQVQLSVFDWKNFIAAILVIIVVYLVLRSSRKKSKSRAKAKKRR